MQRLLGAPLSTAINMEMICSQVVSCCVVVVVVVDVTILLRSDSGVFTHQRDATGRANHSRDVGAVCFHGDNLEW